MDEFKDIENWFFLSVCANNHRVFIYSENLNKNFILSKNFGGLRFKEIQFNNIFLFSQEKFEISKFKIINSYIDLYDSILKESFLTLISKYKTCDAECLKCDTLTGICLECSLGKIPLNNTCPMTKSQIILNDYYSSNDPVNNKSFYAKDYLKNGVPNFISFNYTITFYFSSIGNISYVQDLNHRTVFSMHNSKKLQSNLTYQLIIVNHTLYLKYYDIMRNLIEYKALSNIDEFWTNVILSHNVLENQLTIFILNQCDNITETHNIDNIILVPLDNNSFITIGGESNLNRYVGYIFDLSLYSNKLFEEKTIQIIRGIFSFIKDLYSNSTSENKQCVSPLIKRICGKLSYSVNHSPNFTCASKFI